MSKDISSAEWWDKQFTQPEWEYIYTVEGRQVGAKDVNGHWGLRGIFSTEEKAQAAMEEYLADPLHRMLGYEYQLERAVMDQVNTYYTVPQDEDGNNDWDLDHILINGDKPALVRRAFTEPLKDHEVTYTEINDDLGHYDFDLDSDGDKE